MYILKQIFTIQIIKLILNALLYNWFIIEIFNFKIQLWLFLILISIEIPLTSIYNECQAGPKIDIQSDANI